MHVFLRLLCISQAHGMWHWGSWHMAFGLWPSKFGCLPNAIRLQNRVTLTPVALHRSGELSLEAPSGHPKPPKRTPKPTHGAPKSPKVVQMSPTRRPAAKSHEKSSPKHGPEQRRTTKNDSFPLGPTEKQRKMKPTSTPRTLKIHLKT